jgi:hypothetical protein
MGIDLMMRRRRLAHGDAWCGVIVPGSMSTGRVPAPAGSASHAPMAMHDAAFRDCGAPRRVRSVGRATRLISYGYAAGENHRGAHVEPRGVHIVNHRVVICRYSYV